MLSNELLERALLEWGSLYRRKFKANELDVWKRIFIATDSRILALALEAVTVGSERMPTPGHLTKAIAVVRDQHPEWVPKTGLYYVPSTDKDGKPCVFWSDENMVPAYRPQDCPEGRRYLAKLKEFFQAKDLKPPKFGPNDNSKVYAPPFEVDRNRRSLPARPLK